MTRRKTVRLIESFLFLSLVTFFQFNCEKPDRIWNNPYDPETVLDPGEWAPTNLEVQVISNSEIKLTWTQDEKRISGFNIERKENSGNFTKITDVDPGVTEYTDTGLNYGTKYTYRVQAFTYANESGYSNTALLNLWQDCIGVWGGTSIEDCNGDCEGTAFENECGCVGGGTGLEIDFCYGCTDPNALNYIPNATVDDESCVDSVLNDIDGNIYNVVKIGDQFWMAENLNVTHYSNGDSIQYLTNNTEWTSTLSGAYCNYNNDESNIETYGRLYNWYAVNDNRNIAPEGWHVATDADWQTLVDYLGGSDVAGGKLKESGTQHWENPNTGATNESGFTALPGGYRYSYIGNFYYLGYEGYIWSSTEKSNAVGGKIFLRYNNTEATLGDGLKNYGFSVRCIKDN